MKKTAIANPAFLWVTIIGFSLIIVLIKVLSLNPHLVEKYYSTGIYPYIAQTFRVLFGWLPFSFGDLLYTAAALYAVIKLYKLLIIIRRKKINFLLFRRFVFKVAFLLALIYVCFNVFWGLNYNRLGIAHQLNLSPDEHTQTDLRMITAILVQKVNESRRRLDTVVVYPLWKEMFTRAQAAYEVTSKEFPFLEYKARSVKRSMYGRGGNYFGFLGYYNPFTGESQLNLTQPRFLIPFVTCHEIGHQLGYASESEANFVGYLAAVHSTDPLFQYSVYFDLYRYANRELFVRDSIAAKNNSRLLDTLVKKDFAELRNFYKKYQNPFEPVVHSFYDKYLKANQQDKGIESYNYVIGLLIAYHKKYGKI